MPNGMLCLPSSGGAVTQSVEHAISRPVSVWQDVTMSYISLGARPRDSLVVD